MEGESYVAITKWTLQKFNVNPQNFGEEILNLQWYIVM